jgi:hypothetical protein
MQKMAFCNAKRGLPQRRSWSFAKQLDASYYAVKHIWLSRCFAMTRKMSNFAA